MARPRIAPPDQPNSGPLPGDVPPPPFSRYMQEMIRTMARSGVAEAPPPPAPPECRLDERFAQCIWFDSLFQHAGLRTDLGNSLEIVHPGRWNGEGGPDFRDAHLRIGGRDLRGDVEIHLSAAGWRQHRHHLNPVYENVVLHAYLWSAANPPTVRSLSGRLIESFAMEPVLFPDLETLQQIVRPEQYPCQSPSTLGLCQPVLIRKEEAWVIGMLEAAGRERLEAKAARFARQTCGDSPAQVLYQALMTSLGHGPGKPLYFLLSKRAPLGELLDHRRDAPPGKAVLLLQSILFHVAGLMPGAQGTGGREDEALGNEAFLGELRALWAPVRRYFSDRLIPPARQWNSGVRPVNFACRRLAGVAWLVDRLFAPGPVEIRFAESLRAFDPGAPPRRLAAGLRKEFIRPFTVSEPADFWSSHYSFSSRPAPRPMKLVGEDRAASVVLNALLPLLLAHSRQVRDAVLEERVWSLYRAFPPLESNAILRHMQLRLFGEHPRGEALLGSEARRQGLLHIFAACCNQNATGCEECAYLQAG